VITGVAAADEQALATKAAPTTKAAIDFHIELGRMCFSWIQFPWILLRRPPSFRRGAQGVRAGGGLRFIFVRGGFALRAWGHRERETAADNLWIS
jgi:hypothetical protein